MMIEIEANAATFDNETGASPFAPLQWLVVAMGARPGSQPLVCSPFGQALVGLFGCDVPNGPCLETLLHTSRIARRCGWGMPSAEVGRFLMAGWSEDQLEALIESVSHPSPCKSERRPFDTVGGVPLDQARFEPRNKLVELMI